MNISSTIEGNVNLKYDAKQEMKELYPENYEELSDGEVSYEEFTVVTRQ